MKRKIGNATISIFDDGSIRLRNYYLGAVITIDMPLEGDVSLLDAYQIVKIDDEDKAGIELFLNGS